MAYSAVFLTLDNTKPVHGFPCSQESAPCPLDIHRLIAYIEIRECRDLYGDRYETGLFRNPEGVCLFLPFFDKLC